MKVTRKSLQIISPVTVTETFPVFPAYVLNLDCLKPFLNRLRLVRY